VSVFACTCGTAPYLASGAVAGIPTLQLRCACGPRSARVLCAYQAEARRASEELVDREGAWPAGRVTGSSPGASRS
jgi:hypothetical protein